MASAEKQSTDVLLSVEDGVGVLTLNAPDRRNALTVQMARQIEEACDTIDHTPSVGAVVVRGAGGHFCSGAHRGVLDDVGADPAEPSRYAALSALYQSFHRIGGLSVPTVAAVRGWAVGAGLNLMLAADVRVVAEDARIMAGFLAIGLHPGGGFFHLLQRAAGPQAAAAIGIAGEEIDGSRAAGLGLAWVAAPDEEVDERAVALATRAATDPELARSVTTTFRLEVDTPISWATARELERPAQLWSLRRRRLAAE
jgi:enoyl-CoA hydratase